jgi:two-component system response regulator DevR
MVFVGYEYGQGNCEKVVRRLSRIFLLEDHSWFRQALANMLEREPDLEVVGEAGSVEEARQEARDKGQQIDLALIDLLLPDGIGTDAIGELRRTKPDLPVLVLTVARGPDLTTWVRSMGADEMISKDSSSQELLAAIRILLRG